MSASNWNGFVWLKFNDKFNWDKWDWFKQSKSIKEYGSTAGEWDGYIKISCNSFHDVEKLVNEELRKQPWIKDTCTVAANWLWTA